MPLVSVIMPVYNGAKYIDEAIESILHQTFSAFEFIIIDDGSTDDTVQHIKRFNDPRILLLKNEYNMGITRSLNRGLEAAKGEYICRMDADDISLPMRIEKQVEFLKTHATIAVVGGRSVLIDSTGHVIGYEGVARKKIGLSKFVHNPFIHGSVMIRKSILETVGYYDVSAIHNEDYNLWLRLLSRFQGCVLDEILLKRRLHAESITSTKEVELVKYRLKTLHHAILHYYRNPALFIFLIRPALAFCYKVVKNKML